MEKAELRQRLLEAIESGELDRNYREAQEASKPFLKELEASRRIPDELLRLRVTI